MSKYTPGPWYVAPGDPQYVFAPTNAKSVAACSSKANARLIAAAPDMLAALQLIANFSNEDVSDMVREIARAAIAKAEGVS